MGEIKIGNVAGSRFLGSRAEDGFMVTRHATHGERIGFFHVCKRLVNRAAFNYDPRMGWEYDRWFTWKDPPTPEQEAEMRRLQEAIQRKRKEQGLDK